MVAVGCFVDRVYISAEQFIGIVLGSGFRTWYCDINLTNGWLAPQPTLQKKIKERKKVVAIFSLPIYYEGKGIYTMPGLLLLDRLRFLEFAFDFLTMAIFWLLYYVFVKLTSVLLI